MWATYLIHMFICIHMYSYVRMYSYVYTHMDPSVWHDVLICVTWRLPMCDKAHAYVGHASFLCATWPIHMRDGRLAMCVAVCCRVLPCVAVCCSVLRCVAVCCSVLQCDLLCATWHLLREVKMSRTRCAAHLYLYEQSLYSLGTATSRSIKAYIRARQGATPSLCDTATFLFVRAIFMSRQRCGTLSRWRYRCATQRHLQIKISLCDTLTSTNKDDAVQHIFICRAQIKAFNQRDVQIKAFNQRDVAVPHE